MQEAGFLRNLGRHVASEAALREAEAASMLDAESASSAHQASPAAASADGESASSAPQPPPVAASARRTRPVAGSASHSVLPSCPFWTYVETSTTASGGQLVGALL